MLKLTKIDSLVITAFHSPSDGLKVNAVVIGHSRIASRRFAFSLYDDASMHLLTNGNAVHVGILKGVRRVNGYKGRMLNVHCDKINKRGM